MEVTINALKRYKILSHDLLQQEQVRMALLFSFLRYSPVQLEKRALALKQHLMLPSEHHLRYNA